MCVYGPDREKDVTESHEEGFGGPSFRREAFYLVNSALGAEKEIRADISLSEFCIKQFKCYIMNLCYRLSIRYTR